MFGYTAGFLYMSLFTHFSYSRLQSIRHIRDLSNAELPKILKLLGYIERDPQINHESVFSTDLHQRQRDS